MLSQPGNQMTKNIWLANQASIPASPSKVAGTDLLFLISSIAKFGG
jgi:hypothetical protein